MAPKQKTNYATTSWREGRLEQVYLQLSNLHALGKLTRDTLAVARRLLGMAIAGVIVLARDRSELELQWMGNPLLWAVLLTKEANIRSRNMRDWKCGDTYSAASWRNLDMRAAVLGSNDAGTKHKVEDGGNARATLGGPVVPFAEGCGEKRARYRRENSRHQFGNAAAQTKKAEVLNMLLEEVGEGLHDEVIMDTIPGVFKNVRTATEWPAARRCAAAASSSAATVLSPTIGGSGSVEGRGLEARSNVDEKSEADDESEVDNDEDPGEDVDEDTDDFFGTVIVVADGDPMADSDEEVDEDEAEEDEVDEDEEANRALKEALEDVFEEMDEEDRQQDEEDRQQEKRKLVREAKRRSFLASQTVEQIAKLRREATEKAHKKAVVAVRKLAREAKRIADADVKRVKDEERKRRHQERQIKLHRRRAANLERIRKKQAAAKEETAKGSALCLWANQKIKAAQRGDEHYWSAEYFNARVSVLGHSEKSASFDGVRMKLHGEKPFCNDKHAESQARAAKRTARPKPALTGGEIAFARYQSHVPEQLPPGFSWMF